MKHYGDITKQDGFLLPPVDVVTGGSPCQNLSIAGNREGLCGAQSGLFMEQIRIVRELREADRNRGRTGEYIRPRHMVWENVPGAFSSNGGRDFQRVLTECVRIAEPSAPDVPMPEKGWTKAGVLMGDGWSLAWRVLDAQYWGVPQRRRRIALVCDFGGESAPEILFERESVSGDIAESGAERQRVTRAVEGGAYPAVARSLTARADGSPCIDRGPEIVVQNAVNSVHCLTPWEPQSQRVYGTDGAYHTLYAAERAGMQRDAVLAVHQNQAGEVRTGQVANTLSTNSNASGRNAPLCYDARGNGDGETVNTLTGDHQNRVTDYTALCIGNGQLNQVSMSEQANTLDTMHDQQAVIVGPVVRRLTPLECERLQGYPDGLTDIGDYTDSKGRTRKTSDSARYKALGNSIALPPWRWVLSRIAAQYDGAATLGSLFDGIGGFPLIWQEINGAGTALWASEIEEFCIAVTRRRLGDEQEAIGC